MSKGKQKGRSSHKKRNKKYSTQRKQSTCSQPNQQNNSLYSENERKTILAQIIEQEWKGNTLKPKGLTNLGNTCFLNAVLQNIARLPALRSYFLGQPIQSGERGLTLSLRVFFHTMWLLQDCSSFRPNKLLEQLGIHSNRFRSFEQQDAHEALRILLESLMEEATSSVDSSSDSSRNSESDNHHSWIEKVFLGSLQSCVECEQCHSVSTVEEPFLDISLSLESLYTGESCSVAGGCYSNNPTSVMDIHSVGNDPRPSLVVENNLSQVVETGPEMVSLFEEDNLPCEEEDDIQQVTLGLSFLFEESLVESSRNNPHSDIRQRVTTSASSCTLYASIQDSLQAFLSPEILQGENAYYCESCNQHLTKSTKRVLKDSQSKSYIRTKAKKLFLLKKLPQVIIFHLKRFRQVGYHFEKVSGNISFPLEWNLSQYTIDNKEEDSTENVYYLSGIVVHQGSLEWGHYIAYIRASCSPQEHRWYYCSDEHVTLVMDEEQILHSEAYILFYCKKQRQ